MRYKKALGWAGIFLISACNSPEATDVNATAPVDVEENASDAGEQVAQAGTYPEFTDAIKFAFSSDFQERISNAMAQNAPRVVATNLGSRAFEFTCETQYESRGYAAPSDAANFDACGIIARVSKNLADAEKENLFRAEIDGDVTINKVWEGQAKFQNRTLPAIMLEARFGIINRGAGYKKAVCVRDLYVDDKEFSVRRGSRYLSCDPEDPEQIEEAMAANEVQTPYRAGASASPASNGSIAQGGQTEQAPAQRQSTHAQAVADNKLSTQGIMAAWNAIDRSTQADILPRQRAWIKSKDANCAVEAASSSLDQTERETARLNCDTKANRSRIEWLKQYLPQ